VSNHPHRNPIARQKTLHVTDSAGASTLFLPVVFSPGVLILFSTCERVLQNRNNPLVMGMIGGLFAGQAAPAVVNIPVCS